MVFRSGGTVEAALTDYPVEPEQREALVRQLLADLGLRCELLGGAHVAAGPDAVQKADNRRGHAQALGAAL